MKTCSLFHWKRLIAISVLSYGMGASAADWGRIQANASAINPRAAGSVKDLRLGLRDWKSKPELELVEQVNAFYNEKISFASDLSSP